MDQLLLRNQVDLEQLASEAVAKHEGSDIEVAMHFLQATLPEFVQESNDRLVKIGRSIHSLVSLRDHIPFAKSLELFLEECQLLLSKQVKVPKVRFGKTELQIPIVTLGCMRFQQEWGTRITNMNMVGSDCQDNLVAILRRAILEFGINHIETARGYGSSELQLGVALKQLFASGLVKREELIIQTKIGANASAKEFRAQLEHSMERLQVEYLDLFAFHGLAHYEEQMEWVFGQQQSSNGNKTKRKKETCLDVVQDFIKAGKIRYLGFSSHGPTHLIRRALESNAFDYVNLHNHYFGSYTNSGCGGMERGNADLMKLAKEKDLGIFIISPYDKGGKLYKPSRKLRSLTLPDMEPMTFGSAWLWNHHLLDDNEVMFHTIPCGAARAVDLDQPAVAAYLHGSRPTETLTKIKAVITRLEEARVKALGKEWVETCYTGIPKHLSSKFCVEHNQIIWLYNMIKAFGSLDFAKERYKSLENNRSKWDDSLSIEENIDKKIGKVLWGWTPGLPIVSGTDYSVDFANVPEENKLLVKAAEEFVHKWCATLTKGKGKRGQQSQQDETEQPPDDWLPAYNMSPWKDFPDRPSST